MGDAVLRCPYATPGISQVHALLLLIVHAQDVQVICRRPNYAKANYALIVYTTPFRLTYVPLTRDLSVRYDLLLPACQKEKNMHEHFYPPAHSGIFEQGTCVHV